MGKTQDPFVLEQMKCPRKWERPDITLSTWWPDLESNQGHKDFQSFALPTELSGLKKLLLNSENDVESRGSFFF